MMAGDFDDIPFMVIRFVKDVHVMRANHKR